MRERWTVRWFRKRALLYHLFVVILVPGCLLAGWWQINRAESGNTLSYLYAVEWPIFAIMSFVGWWQLIHEDPAHVEARKVERARRAATRGPFVPPPPDADSGFYHPLQPGAQTALGATGGGGDLVFADGDDAPDGDGESVEVHALSSYNAYLARLSAGGGRKSWRNPHGITASTVRADPTPVAPDAERPRLDADPGRSLTAGPGIPEVAADGDDRDGDDDRDGGDDGRGGADGRRRAARTSADVRSAGQR